MTTIADAFLDDLDEEESTNIGLVEEVQTFTTDEIVCEEDVETLSIGSSSDDEDEGKFKKSGKINTDNFETNTKQRTVESISNLVNEPRLKQHLEKIERLMECDPKDSFYGRIEDNEEYRTIMQSNDIVTEIGNDIVAIHKFIRDIYAVRFPELEQTVVHPVDYTRIVHRIGNKTDIQSSDLDGGICSDHQKLTITIAASATTGKPLNDEDLNRLMHACDVVLQLNNAQQKIYNYISSRMIYIAPNLSALVGSEIASQLMGLAGGLLALSKIPSCNVQTLGSTKRSRTVYLIDGVNPNVGILGHCSLVASCPPDLRNRALRQIAAKCVLATRTDCFQDQPSDTVGIRLSNEIKNKIEKWQEPPPPKPIKPLPLPEEKAKNKRGGKRYRKMKEKYKVTEVQRMKNRMGFNVAEEQTVEGEGFGMLGQSGTGGQLRVVAKDTQKLRKLEKINKMIIEKQRKKMQRRMGGGEISGISTSIVMTEVQGMSFVNPDNLNPKPRKPKHTYFGTPIFSNVSSSTNNISNN